MALNSKRNAVTITDADGDEHPFLWGVNARRELKRRTHQDVKSVFRKAFALKAVTVQEDGKDVEKTEASGDEWDLDLLCTVLSCCSLEKLTEDEIGELLDDVGVEKVLDIFGGKQGTENPTTTTPS